MESKSAASAGAVKKAAAKKRKSDRKSSSSSAGELAEQEHVRKSHSPTPVNAPRRRIASSGSDSGDAERRASNLGEQLRSAILVKNAASAAARTESVAASAAAHVIATAADKGAGGEAEGGDQVDSRAPSLGEQLRRALLARQNAASAAARSEGGTAPTAAAHVITTAADNGAGDEAAGEDQVDGAGASHQLATGLAAQIDDAVLLCSICLDCYREPKVLPCQHTYCRECLETILNAQASKSTLLCPECRFEVTVPDGGVRYLATNYLVNKLVDLLQLYRGDDVVKTTVAATRCDQCRDETAGDVVAEARCTECTRCLCTRHSSAHRADQHTCAHTLVPIATKQPLAATDGHDASPWQPVGGVTSSAGTEDAHAEQQAIACKPDHHDSTELWCTGCRTYVCSHCEEPVHRQHHIVPVSVAIMEEKSTLERKVSELEQVMVNVETATSLLDQCQATVDREADKVMFDVHTCFQRLIDGFAARRSLMMDEISCEKTARCKTLRLQKEDLLFQAAKIRASMNSIKATVESTSEADILRDGQGIGEKVQSLLDNKFQLSPQVCQGVYFDNSWEEIVVQYIEKLAHVDMTQVSPSLCTASGLGLSSTMTRGKDAVIDIMVVDANGDPSDHPKDQVTVVVYPPSADHQLTAAAAPLASTTATSASQSSTNSSESSTTSTSSSTASSSSLSSSSSRVSQTRQPLVTTKNHEQSRKGHYSSVYVPRDEGQYTVEVCVNGWPIRGSPFTPKVPPGRDYTTIGNAVPVTFGGEGKGESRFRSPHGIAIDKQCLLHVADMLNHRIQVFNPHGGFIRSFGDRGPNPGQFVEPIGITIDDDGHVVVTDYSNHRLQVLRHNGTAVRCIGKKGTAAGSFALPFDVATFCHPTIGLCYAVTEFENHRVQVIQSDGVSVKMFGEKGNGEGQFTNPAGIAVSSELCFYVADHNNHRIQIFNVEGEFQSSFGQHGSAMGCLDHPCGVAIDPLGNVLVTEYVNSRVQIFSANDFSPIAILGSADTLRYPTGLAINKEGSVYVCSEHKITIF